MDEKAYLIVYNRIHVHEIVIYICNLNLVFDILWNPFNLCFKGKAFVRYVLHVCVYMYSICTCVHVVMCMYKYMHNDWTIITV